MKGLKFLKFDEPFRPEGCGGRLRRQYECRMAAAPPFGALRHHLFPQLRWWDYGCSAMVPHDTVGKHREAYSVLRMGESPAQPDKGEPR